ncbi:hypothetical protein IAT38_006282 [Cryptococcus sp. DSM 104549]
MPRPHLRDWHSRLPNPPLAPSPILKTFPLEVIANIIKHTPDTPTLLAWARVNSFLTRAANERIYGRPFEDGSEDESGTVEDIYDGGETVHLHTTQAVIRYITQTQDGSAPRARHLDVMLDAEFFHVYGLTCKVSPGMEFNRRSLRDIGLDSTPLMQHVWRVLDLLVPLGGPRHFRWQVLDFTPYKEIPIGEPNRAYECRCTCRVTHPETRGDMCACIPRQVSTCWYWSFFYLQWPNLVSEEQPPLHLFHRHNIVYPREDSLPSLQHSGTDWRQQPTVHPEYVPPDLLDQVSQNILLFPPAFPSIIPYSTVHRMVYLPPSLRQPPSEGYKGLSDSHKLTLWSTE